VEEAAFRLLFAPPAAGGDDDSTDDISCFGALLSGGREDRMVDWTGGMMAVVVNAGG
jgi:hypothetical protein